MENENKINEMYDKLLEIADTPSDNDNGEEINNKMQELKESFDKIDSTVDDNESSTIDSADSAVAMSSYNPETGEVTITDNPEQADETVNKNLNAFLKDGKVDLTSIENIMNSKEVKDLQDSAKIASIIQRRLNGESFNYYEELPNSIKLEISKILMNLNYDGTNKKSFNKNYVAKLIIDDMVENYKKESQKDLEFDLDTLLTGFNKDIEKMQDQFASDLGNIMITFDEERRAEIDAGIKRCEESGNTEAVDKLKKIKNTIDKAYTLDDFAEFCLHCKIKNYDLKEPNRVYGNFNYKYLTHKNTINDIKSCPGILDRHMPDIDHKYKVMICLAFCKYCQNMSPDNIEEHTFMYYFIRNIIAIDRFNPKGIGYDTMDEKAKKFYDEFTSNLRKCIFNLLERNVTLK